MASNKHRCGVTGQARKDPGGRVVNRGMDKVRGKTFQAIDIHRPDPDGWSHAGQLAVSHQGPRPGATGLSPFRPQDHAQYSPCTPSYPPVLPLFGASPFGAREANKDKK